LTGRTAGTGAELTGDNPHLNVPNQAMAKLPVPAHEQREAIIAVPTRHGSTSTEFSTAIHHKKTSTTELYLRVPVKQVNYGRNNPRSS